MKVRADGAWRDVSSGRVRIGGAWRPIVSARAYIGGAWREVVRFTPPLSASTSPSSTSGTIIGEGTAFSPVVTVTPSGGLAPYTYSCVVLTGTGSVQSPTSASSRFSRYMENEETATTVFRWTVTDSLGSTATANVTVSFQSFNFS